MTLPARVPSAYQHSADTPLPMQNPPALDSAAVLASLVARPLTDGAFKIAAAMLVLSSRSLRWLDLPEVATTAGMTEGRARQFLGELVRARVITRQKQLVYRDGKPTARNRYALAVTA